MPEIELAQLIPMLILLMCIGAIAGVLAGLLGVGGGIILVPAFFYGFAHLGYDGAQLMQVCIGTSLATIIVTSVRSVVSHHRKGAVDLVILRSFAPFIIAGAVAGVLMASQMKSVTLQAVFGALALIAGGYLGFGRDHWRLGAQMPRQPALAAVALPLGFFSALMGIGGGTFGVPLLTLYAVPIHRAVAMAAGFGVAIAVPAGIGFLLMPIPAAPPYSIGAVNIPAFVVVIAMTLITTPYGVALAHRTGAKLLKRVFALFISLVALNMLRKVVGW